LLIKKHGTTDVPESILQNRSVAGDGWCHTAARPSVDHGEQRPQSSVHFVYTIN